MRRNNISGCHTGIFHFKRLRRRKVVKDCCTPSFIKSTEISFSYCRWGAFLLVLLLQTNQSATVSYFDSFLYFASLLCDVVVKMSCSGRGDHFMAVIRRDIGSRCLDVIFRGLSAASSTWPPLMISIKKSKGH